MRVALPNGIHEWARLLILMAVVFEVGCGRKPQINTGFIERPGEYRVSGGRCVVVTEGPHGLISYAAKDHNGATLLAATQPFSDSQRWYLYWDEHDQLWIHSSDIGTFVWSKDADNHYAMLTISNSSPASIARMPDSFYARLPSSLRARFDPLRKK
jgi:hypothetical protein